VPLRIAIGVVYDGELKFVGGPVDAVKATAKAPCDSGTGHLAGKDLLKTMFKIIVIEYAKEQRAEVTRASVEAIREFVPYHQRANFACKVNNPRVIASVITKILKDSLTVL